jgi:hypothetical protein
MRVKVRDNHLTATAQNCQLAKMLSGKKPKLTKAFDTDRRPRIAGAPRNRLNIPDAILIDIEAIEDGMLFEIPEA